MREIEAPDEEVPAWYRRRVALCKWWHVVAAFTLSAALHLFFTAAGVAGQEPVFHVVVGVQLVLIFVWLLLAFWPATPPRHRLRIGLAVATTDDNKQGARVVAACTCGWKDDPSKSARADTPDASAQAQHAWSVHVALEDRHDRKR